MNERRSGLNLEAADALVAEIRSSGGSAKRGARRCHRPRFGSRRHLGRRQRHGRLDAYFNNAGMNAPMNFLDVTEQTSTWLCG